MTTRRMTVGKPIQLTEDELRALRGPLEVREVDGAVLLGRTVRAKRRLARPEQGLQQAVWAWAQCYRIAPFDEGKPVHLSDFLVHVPSGIPSGGPKAPAAERRRAHVAGAIRKSMGAPDDFPDLVLMIPSRMVERDEGERAEGSRVVELRSGGLRLLAGAVLELKAPGKYPSEGQRAWLERLDSVGYAAAWTDTFEGACEYFKRYLAGRLVPWAWRERWSP